MKLIPLTQGKFAKVDDVDYPELSKYKWCTFKGKNGWYAVRGIKNKVCIYMHREILGLRKGDGICTDHKNHDGLDNRRCNLRICTRSQNCFNRHSRKNSSSRYKGVSWKKRVEKWMVQIQNEGKSYYLGYFESEIDAALAYDEKAVELFGDFAYLNFRKTA